MRKTSWVGKGALWRTQRPRLHVWGTCPLKHPHPMVSNEFWRYWKDLFPSDRWRCATSSLQICTNPWHRTVSMFWSTWKIAKNQKTKRENPEIQSSFGKVFNQLSFKVKMPHWSEYELSKSSEQNLSRIHSVWMLCGRPRLIFFPMMTSSGW